MVKYHIQQKRKTPSERKTKMPGKYIKNYIDVYDLMSSEDESEIKVHFQLLQFDFYYVKIIFTNV